jgi:ribosomal protein L22
MLMKGYSSNIPDNCACARLEGVNASYKDLAQVCGSIRSKKADWALSFLEKAAEGDVAIHYKGHNKRLGHRKELGGRKGRYPKKAAKIVLKLLKSAISNGKNLGLGEAYTIVAAQANKKNSYPRVAAKGRWARSFLETSRVEIILQGSEIPKGVEVTPPAAKKEEPKKPEPKETKKPEPKAEKPKAAPKEKPAAEKPKEKAAPKEEKTEEAPKEKDERPPPKLLKKEAQRDSVGKKQEEEQLDAHKMQEGKPHHRGDDSKR